MNLSKIIKDGVSEALLEASGNKGFRVFATVGSKVIDEIPDVTDKEVKDVVEFLKTSHKGAKISVEYKGKIVQTTK